MSKPIITWTPEHDVIIRAEYKRTSTHELAARFGVEIHTVRVRAKTLGLTSKKNPVWTEEELGRLERHFPKLGMHACKFFPNRSENAVKLKADRMGFYVGNPSDSSRSARLTVYRAAQQCDVDREVILRLAVRDGTLERRGRLQTVPELWLEQTVRREYPNGSIGLRKRGYLSLKRAAPLIGIDRRTLEQAANHNLPGPVRDALEGIVLHRAGACTYINPHDVERIRNRLKTQRSSGTTMKSLAIDAGVSVNVMRVRQLDRSRFAIVGGRRQRVVLDALVTDGLGT
jgi:hypothetical protein